MRFIGAAKLAAAIGLILPAATRILPVLTPFAGGLTVIMALAMAFHLARGETSAIGINLVLGALAALVASRRLGKAPGVARSEWPGGRRGRGVEQPVGP